MISCPRIYVIMHEGCPICWYFDEREAADRADKLTETDSSGFYTKLYSIESVSAGPDWWPDTSLRGKGNIT